MGLLNNAFTIINKRTMISVANTLMMILEPINCPSYSSFAPAKKRTNPLLVIPYLNISIKDPPEINNTHCAKSSGLRLLANKAKPPKPKTAITRFPAKERKLSSLMSLLINLSNMIKYDCVSKIENAQYSLVYVLCLIFFLAIPLTALLPLLSQLH